MYLFHWTPCLKLQWSYLHGVYGIIPMHLFGQLFFKSDVNQNIDHRKCVTVYTLRFTFRPSSLTLCPCSTGRRCHGARTAYEKNNRYAARSPRWFGGISPVLLFRMSCVSTAYGWRMDDAHAAHMAYEWRCHCVWCRVWELDHCVFTVQVAHTQRTSHVRAAVNAILWRMAGVCTAHELRTCRTYKYTSTYVSCECDI